MRGVSFVFWKRLKGPLGGSFAALVPDRDVRVSVKALALSCIGAAVALHPESFFSTLYKVPLDTVESTGMLTVHQLICA